MKNIILTLTIVLLVMWAALWLLGRNDGYIAEKILYKAARTYDKILTNPDATPPMMLEAAANDLKRVMKEYPDKEAANLARMKLIELYMTSSKFREAIPLLDEIIAREAANPERASKAIYMKALAYEKMGSWAMAVKEFEKLERGFSNTMLGLQTPLYVANHYRLNGQKEEAAAALDKAVSFYNNIHNANEGTTLGFISLTMLMETYGKFRLYEPAADVLEKMISAYPVDTAFVHVLPFIDTIYIENLNDPARALSVYETIYEKTAEEKIKAFTQGKIAELKKQ
ncbi:MAG: tetratricopeptide repeat protein [Candidatus Omnitrophota bacterium]